MDPQTKAISLASDSHPKKNSLQSELEILNRTHRSLQQNLEGGQQTPPPPVPVKKNRTDQINKLKESASAAAKKGGGGDGPGSVNTEAIKLYTLALDMAYGRPGWEPAGLLREELAQLYNLRSAAYSSGRLYADAWIDAKCSAESKTAGNATAYLRGVTALTEMGRRREARLWAEQGLKKEEDSLENVRSQVYSAQKQGANSQQLSSMREQVKAFEKEIEELKGVVADMKTQKS